MKAIIKHEISSYFSSLTGYVFGAFVLLFAGIYTMVYNLKTMVTNFEYVLANMSFIFLIVVPILTMKVLAEEKRQKTDQLLYSLPISMTEVVLGKYLALLAVFAFPLALICIYPLVLTAFGDVYLITAYSALFGFFFLGAALLSIGMFISSITENQAVAAGLCFVVMLINYYLTSLSEYVSSTAFSTLIAFTVVILFIALIIRIMTKSTLSAFVIGGILEIGVLILYITKTTEFEGLFPELMSKLSLFDRFYEFVNGLFSLEHIVYFITVMGVFLFLSVQSMEKRRWSE